MEVSVRFPAWHSGLKYQVLPQLWHRLAVATHIHMELPYAMDATIKCKERKKEKRSEWSLVAQAIRGGALTKPLPIGDASSMPRS